MMKQSCKIKYWLLHKLCFFFDAPQHAQTLKLNLLKNAAASILQIRFAQLLERATELDLEKPITEDVLSIAMDDGQFRRYYWACRELLNDIAKTGEPLPNF